MDIITYILSKSFTKKSIAGVGAIKGSPCKLISVTPEPSSVDPSVPIKQKLKFQWDSNNDPAGSPHYVETEVELIDFGRNIYSIDLDSSASTASDLWYKVKYYDGTEGGFKIPVSSSGMRKKVVTTLPAAADADKNTIYLREVATKPGTYEQWIAVENDAHIWEWLMLGTTDVDMDGYQKKIDPNLTDSYINYDPATKTVEPVNKNLVGGINEHQKAIGARYDFTTGKIPDLETHSKTSLVDAINDMGNLENLEMWNPTTQTPATLVDAINIAHSDFSTAKQATIDRSKYINEYKLVKDKHDGSAPVPVSGDPIDIPRVDVKAKTTPDANDYRTYDVKYGGELYDPSDSSHTPYGSIKIPTVKIVKMDPPVQDASKTVVISPTSWTEIVPGEQYTRDVILDKPITTETTSPGPVATLVTPAEIGGTFTIQVDYQRGAAQITLKLVGTGITFTANDASIKVDYKVNNVTLASQYYIDIEGRGYDEARCGKFIEIGKDMILDGASVEICVTPDDPPGCVPGDKYIDLRFRLADGSITHVKIPCKDLFDPYQGVDAINVAYSSTSRTNTISLKIHDPDGTNALTQSTDGLRIDEATVAKYGVVKYANASEVINTSSSVSKVLTPYDTYRILTEKEMQSEITGLYYDPVALKQPNAIVTKAISELATGEIKIKTTPDPGDVETYYFATEPATGVEDVRGTIHIKRQIQQVEKISTILDPKNWLIYCLIKDELPDYEKGLYVYDDTVTPGKFIKVDDSNAIERENNDLPAFADATLTKFYAVTETTPPVGFYTTSAVFKAMPEKSIWPEGIFDENTSKVTPWDEVARDWATKYYTWFTMDSQNYIIALFGSTTAPTKIEYHYSAGDGQRLYYLKESGSTKTWIEVRPTPIPQAVLNTVTRID